jgi:hypothetical protein
MIHRLAGRFVPEDADVEVMVGIETGRGPWVAALIAAGYAVFPMNRCRPPCTVSRMGCRGSRATVVMRACWRTWCAPIPTRSARSRWTPGDRGPQRQAAALAELAHITSARTDLLAQYASQNLEWHDTGPYDTVHERICALVPRS